MTTPPRLLQSPLRKASRAAHTFGLAPPSSALGASHRRHTCSTMPPCSGLGLKHMLAVQADRLVQCMARKAITVGADCRAAAHSHRFHPALQHAHRPVEHALEVAAARQALAVKQLMPAGLRSSAGSITGWGACCMWQQCSGSLRSEHRRPPRESRLWCLRKQPLFHRVDGCTPGDLPSLVGQHLVPCPAHNNLQAAGLSV